MEQLHTKRTVYKLFFYKVFFKELFQDETHSSKIFAAIFFFKENKFYFLHFDFRVIRRINLFSSFSLPKRIDDPVPSRPVPFMGFNIFYKWQRRILNKWQRRILNEWQKRILNEWQRRILNKWQRRILNKWLKRILNEWLKRILNKWLNLILIEREKKLSWR